MQIEQNIETACFQVRLALDFFERFSWMEMYVPQQIHTGV